MEANPPGLSDILRSVPVPTQLSSKCTDEHFADIAHMIIRWEEIAPYMDISEAEEVAIKSNHHSYEEQKLACLRKWKKKMSYRATYQQLIQIFYKARQIDLSYNVAKMLSEVSIANSITNEVDKCHQYLVENYLQESPPGTAEYPFTESHDFHYIELSLQTRTRGSIQTKPLEMEEIFNYGKEERHVTLVQGAAGSGKSTLVWKLKRCWAKGELYPDIKLLISVNVRDPEYHTAKTLTDVIPCPTKEMKQAVVDHIRKKMGEGVCFIWDGWDEVPYKYQRRSYLYNLLVGRTLGESLPRAKFLVTSRSIGTTIVRGIAPKHVEIKSLSTQQIKDYLSRQVHANYITEIEEYVKQNEQLLALPMNTTLVSRMLSDPRYNGRNPLPKTQTELYTNLTQCLLISEADRRSDLVHDPEVLPDSSKLVLKKFSSLAYNGVITETSLFVKKDLAKYHIDTTDLDHTQGLMIVNPIFTSLGLDKSYTFRHLTFQEYMAACYIGNHLQAQEQCDAISEIIKNHPDRIEVLGFLAGLKSANCSSTLKDLWCGFLHGDLVDNTQRIFHILMKCAFESQSEGLLLFFHDSILSTGCTTIAFKHFKLEYQDLSMLGKILGRGPLPVPLTVDASACTLDSGALNAFTNELQASKSCPSGLTLILDGTRLAHSDIEALVILISTTVALSHLSMNDCGVNDTDVEELKKVLAKICSLESLKIDNFHYVQPG